MIRSLAAMTIAISLSASALAGTSITATLESPKDRMVKIVAVKALWTCERDTCTATLTRDSISLSTCKQVAKSLGKVSAFSSDRKTLSAAQLEKCNDGRKS